MLFPHTHFFLLTNFRAHETHPFKPLSKDFPPRKAPFAFLPIIIRHRHRMMILYYKNPVGASFFFISPLWITVIKQKRVQKSEVYSYIPLSSHSNHTLNILSFTLNPRAMEIPRQKHSIVFRY